MVLQRLELPYRVVERCVEIWGFRRGQGLTISRRSAMPTEWPYREISSCSNYDAFGARRRVRYRPRARAAEFCATLNGSGWRSGRTVMAVLENYSGSDGTVTVPTALRPYMDGPRRLTRLRR